MEVEPRSSIHAVSCIMPRLWGPEAGEPTGCRKGDFLSTGNVDLEEAWASEKAPPVFPPPVTSTAAASCGSTGVVAAAAGSAGVGRPCVPVELEDLLSASQPCWSGCRFGCSGVNAL